MDSSEDLSALALQKIAFGENLVQSIQVYKSLEGLPKLERKINQEIKFLKKICKSKRIKKEHIQCSNLTHFSAVIDVLKCNIENCISVNKVFFCNERKVCVDIVADDGLSWIKIVARNPKSLAQICRGNSSFGVRSVVDQAEDYIECAKLYPCFFQLPKITFVFINGISNEIATILESYGIVVKGDRTEIYDDIENTTNSETYEKPTNSETEIYRLSSTNATTYIPKVNLDVSAMLAYCSSVTNGSADLYDFNVPVLQQQAAWERKRPQKPILDKFFLNKKLYCCQTAHDNFLSILNTVGGPNEKLRGEALLKECTVLPDNATVKDIDAGDNNCVQLTSDKSLAIGGQIRERSLLVFTFGDRIQAVTVTANEGFVQAAKQQGVNFVVFVHESRALTEQKEQTGFPKL